MGWARGGGRGRDREAELGHVFQTLGRASEGPLGRERPNVQLVDGLRAEPTREEHGGLVAGPLEGRAAVVDATEGAVGLRGIPGVGVAPIERAALCAVAVIPARLQGYAVVAASMGALALAVPAVVVTSLELNRVLLGGCGRRAR
jgi:hypothetical protein